MQSVSERVLSLIEASGLSRRAFGERIGLDESKMSKSLSGTRRFSSMDLARIAEECRVTVDWLLTGEEPPVAVAARTTSGNAAAALDAARRYSTLRSDMASLGYPQPWRPLVSGPSAAAPSAAAPDSGGRGGYQEQGRRLARQALARVGHVWSAVGSGTSLTAVELLGAVEASFGVDVAVVVLGDGFDGLSVSSGDVKLIVLATSHIPARQRFTLAHELGHLLAGDDQGVHLDRNVFDKAQAKDPTEMRANAFASEFLMPEPVLRDAVGPTGLTEPGFAAMACDLTVTPSALAFQLLRLRLIDAGTCDRFKAMTAARAASLAGRGEWFAQQVTEAGRPRPPGLLVRDTYAAYDAGAATLRPYATLLGAEVDQLRRELELGQGIHDAT